MKKETNQSGKVIEMAGTIGGAKILLAALKAKRLTATMRRRALKPKRAAK